MSDTIEQALDPVVVESWLVQHQRGRFTGASPLTTFQGLIADEIFLPQSAADHADPAQLVLAMDAWVEALTNQAFYLPGEFAQEALWSLYARDYQAQVQAGGHDQYYANRCNDEIALRCCQSGLKSMLADPHLDLFNSLIKLKRLKPNAAKKFAKEKGYGSIAAAIRDLDKKFADLEAKEPLTPRQKTWLKSLRKLKLAPDAEMDQHLNRMARINTLFVARREEAQRTQAETMRNEPSYRAANTLCEMAGLHLSGLKLLGFAPMRQAWREGPDVRSYVFRCETDKGVRAALFYADGGMFKRHLAVLVEQGGGLPLGSLTLTREDYAAIVPATA